MPAEHVCWLCEEAVVPGLSVLVRYRDRRGGYHPWPDRRGRWQPEYLCPECALLCPDWDGETLDWEGLGAVRQTRRRARGVRRGA